MTASTTLPSQWTVGTALRRGAALLAAASVVDARLEAELLLAGQLGRRRLDLYCNPDDELAPANMARFAEAIRRRATGEPLQYVRGWEELDGLTIEVAPGALIPRPETELLVQRAAAHLSDLARETAGPRFIDVGTGSGCVAIAVARAVPSASGLAIDCSPAALAVARRNLARHGLNGRVQLLRGDLCGAVAAEGSIGLIAANLPYVPTAAIPLLDSHVRDWEPRVALDGGPDGLALIERLLRTAGPLLSPRGRLMLEIGAGQSAAVSALARAQGWTVRTILPDLAGIDRVMTFSRES